MPQRLLDLPADLLSSALPNAFGGPLPPAALRSRVGSSSRRIFSQVGREGSRQILDAFARTRRPERAYPAWLDFGCGCGRISRFVGGSPAVERLYGVDVDPALIAWAGARLPGTFATVRPEIPLDFEAETFDVVFATSIFTHFTEQEQFRWLEELSRVLKPEGLLIATTISPLRIGGFPELSAHDFARLAERGFVCVNATHPVFNERVAFHSPEYLREHWGRRLAPLLHEPLGFAGYHDLSVWEKRTLAPPAGSRA